MTRVNKKLNKEFLNKLLRSSRKTGGREGGRGAVRHVSFSRINYKAIVSFIIKREKFKLNIREAPELSAKQCNEVLTEK